MKIRASSYPRPMVPPVPEHCECCGRELRGMAIDAPCGWVCSYTCEVQLTAKVARGARRR